ncbi:MAG TPA: helix-turn-helix transcriptional regulator [Thermoanaerobaculia bacterium]|nr:helix-turn-helix transcriptional regulator [Thermoanaerobaculia bacterium]
MELADHVGMSRYKLIREFRGRTELTIRELIQQRVINRACRLLLRTSIPIKEVAFRCGYASPSAFTVAFRQATGLSPSDFAAQNRKRKLL